MKIKLLKTVVLLGYASAVPRGSVVESDNPDAIAEYKALKAVGCAADTTEKATIIQHLPGGNTPPISGIKAKAPANSADDELLLILEGNADAVKEELENLDAAQLTRLGELEVEGKARKGVAEAIDAAIANIEE